MRLVLLFGSLLLLGVVIAQISIEPSQRIVLTYDNVEEKATISSELSTDKLNTQDYTEEGTYMLDGKEFVTITKIDIKGKKIIQITPTIKRTTILNELTEK